MSIEAMSRTLLLCRDFIPQDITDAQLVDAFAAHTVEIVVDERNLESSACQSAIITFAQQLQAMGVAVNYNGPDTNLAAIQPPWSAVTLYGALRELASDGLPGSQITPGRSGSLHRSVFVFGDTHCAARNAWRLSATRFSGTVARAHESAPRWTERFPLGGLAAVTAAAAEPFKAVVRGIVSHSRVNAEQLAPVDTVRVLLAPDDVDINVSFGEVDCISGGAIIQAALHALLRLPSASGKIRVFEPQDLDLSNLNRYPLARRSGVDSPKIIGLQNCSTAALRITGVPSQYDEDLSAAMTLADKVLVGTDNVQSRWLAQGAAPGWLGIGATSHFQAMASEHGPSVRGGCGGCAHPINDNVVATIPTVSFVSYAAGLMLAARLVRHNSGRATEAAKQAMSLLALRLDTKYGQWAHGVTINDDCPVHSARRAARL
jgi:hypothetical protein